jgi:hypothetical protein
MKRFILCGCVVFAVTVSWREDAFAEDGSPPESALSHENIQYFIRCDELTKCAGTPVACVLAGDDSDGDGGHLIEATSLKPIAYGDWSNSPCGTYGVGWHVAAGTCQTGSGAGHKRCKFVYVRP